MSEIFLLFFETEFVSSEFAEVASSSESNNLNKKNNALEDNRQLFYERINCTQFLQNTTRWLLLFASILYEDSLSAQFQRIENNTVNLLQ